MGPTGLESFLEHFIFINFPRQGKLATHKYSHHKISNPPFTNPIYTHVYYIVISNNYIIDTFSIFMNGFFSQDENSHLSSHWLLGDFPKVHWSITICKLFLISNEIN